MKKIGLLLIAFAMATTNFAQITQEEVIVSDNIIGAGFIKLENNVEKYFMLDRTNFTLKLYNIDHSIFKTIQFDVNQMGLTDFPKVDSYYPFCISETLFDTDNEIEFFINIHAYSSDFNNEITKSFVINEDGTILFEKTNQSIPNNDEYIQFPEWIYNTSQGTKLMLKAYNENENDSLYIYSLPGTVPCFNCDGTNKVHNINNKSQELSNYPNPAKDYTIIEYEIPKGENEAEIQIFNMNGQLINTYRVDKTFKDLRISTNNFENGTYIYNIKTKNTISRGNKLIINK